MTPPSTTPTDRDPLDYGRFVLDALRQVVRRALEVVVSEGLSGRHALYLAFRTDHPEVEISDRLRARFPEEMTVVLEHQFWDLAPDERGFGVGLSFSGVRQRLWVPWEALTGFADPSVPFGLQLAEPDGEAASDDEPASAEPGRGEPAAGEVPATPADGGNVVRLDRFRKR